MHPNLMESEIDFLHGESPAGLRQNVALPLAVAKLGLKCSINLQIFLSLYLVFVHILVICFRASLSPCMSLLMNDISTLRLLILLKWAISMQTAGIGNRKEIGIHTSHMYCHP